MVYENVYINIIAGLSYSNTLSDIFIQCAKDVFDNTVGGGGIDCLEGIN